MASSSTVNEPRSDDKKDGPVRTFDDRWRGWLRHNIERGCPRDELFRILHDHGFAFGDIQREMGGYQPTRALASIPNPLATRAREASYALRTGLDYRRVARVAITRTAANGVRRVDTDLCQLYVLDDFMTPPECERMIAIVNKKLRPSTITTTDGPSDYRTSRTCDLGKLDDPFIAEIDERIARTLGVRRAWSEPIQGQRYDIGQEFKEHTDYFEPGTEEFDVYAGDRGQRTWTFMIYLNDTVRGGHTRFVRVERSFEPKRGQALVWNNLYPSGIPNPDTLHHGDKVEEGQKLIITKWFRDHGSGEMEFDGAV